MVSLKSSSSTEGAEPDITYGRDTFHWSQVVSRPSNLTLDISRGRTTAGSLGNMCQGLTALTFPKGWVTLWPIPG